MMDTYFRPTEHVAERVWVDYLGGQYVGRGILVWHPEDGFHLNSFLSRTGSQLPNLRHYGKVGVIPRDQVRSIWLRFARGSWALAPRALLGDQMDLVEQERLSIDLPSVLFFDEVGSTPGNEPRFARPSGSALYGWTGDALFPDRVQRGVTVGGEVIMEASGREGVRYDDEFVSLVGLQDGHQRAEFHWTLKFADASRRDSWLFAEALRDALALTTRSTVQLHRREAMHRNRTREEWRKAAQTRSLDLYAPLDNRPLVDKTLLIGLTKFFLTGGEEARVSRLLFSQIAEAVAQQTWSARELLLATILEAALRTLHNLPFKQGAAGRISLSRELDRFRERYWSDEWIAACQQAVRVDARLRHRNAHPDWLVTKDGSASHNALEKRLDDLIFISRFYGHMILAMAGMGDPKPLFPPPHREWGAMIAVHDGQGSVSLDAPLP
jgi:hypothetical protein